MVLLCTAKEVQMCIRDRTWLDILLVKHTLIAAEKMKNEGDTVSGMTDDMSSSSYVRWNENDNA